MNNEELEIKIKDLQRRIMKNKVIRNYSRAYELEEQLEKLKNNKEAQQYEL